MTAARTEEKGHIREGDALFAFVGYGGGSGVEMKKWRPEAGELTSD